MAGGQLSDVQRSRQEQTDESTWWQTRAGSLWALGKQQDEFSPWTDFQGKCSLADHLILGLLTHKARTVNSHCFTVLRVCYFAMGTELLQNTQSTAGKAEGRGKGPTAAGETSGLHFRHGQSYRANRNLELHCKPTRAARYPQTLGPPTADTTLFPRAHGTHSMGDHALAWRTGEMLGQNKKY